MVDFDELQKRATNSLLFGVSVREFCVSVERGNEFGKEIFFSLMLGMLPEVLKERESDDEFAEALPVITADAYGIPATSWCEWAAEFREAALRALHLSVLVGLGKRICGRDKFLDTKLLTELTEEDLQVLERWLPTTANTVRLPAIDDNEAMGAIQHRIKEETLTAKKASKGDVPQLVTLKQMQMLTKGLIDMQTIYNARSASTNCPEASIEPRGRSAAQFDYAQLRAWFIRNWPDTDRFIPRTYADALPRLSPP